MSDCTYFYNKLILGLKTKTIKTKKLLTIKLKLKTSKQKLITT